MIDLNSQPSEEERRRADELASAFREVLTTASGKRVVFWMLEQCRMTASAYSGENAAATNFSLGEQNVGLKLISQLDAVDPRIYPKMMLERADNEVMDRAIAERSAATEDDDDEAV